jgi:hypothetical protein
MASFTVYVLVAVSMLRAADGTEYELTVLPGAYLSNQKCEKAAREAKSSDPHRQVRCHPVLVER